MVGGMIAVRNPQDSPKPVVHEKSPESKWTASTLLNRLLPFGFDTAEVDLNF